LFIPSDFPTTVLNHISLSSQTNDENLTFAAPAHVPTFSTSFPSCIFPCAKLKYEYSIYLFVNTEINFNHSDSERRTNKAASRQSNDVAATKIRLYNNQQSNFGVLLQCFSSLDTKLGALDTKIDTKIDALDTKIGALDTKIDTKIGALDTKIGALDTNVGALQSNFDKVNIIGPIVATILLIKPVTEISTTLLGMLSRY